MLSDNTLRIDSHLLLIIFAVSLFFFLSHKVAVLLEVQVDLLADPILPIRIVNKACRLLAYSVCRGVDVRPK